MKTKIELVDRAYSKLRISGITVNPTPEEVALAVDELECMVAEWDGKNVCMGYAFEEEPDPSTESGISKQYENAVQSNLAVRLASDFGKDIPMNLQAQANQSYSAASSMSARVKQTDYPRRQPVGEANTLRLNRWRRYYDIQPDAPNDCDTQIMAKGDITDATVSYADYLEDDDSISNYQLDTTGGLEVLEQQNDDTTIMLRVKALNRGTQKIKVTITTVNGLQKTNCLWYSVIGCNN